MGAENHPSWNATSTMNVSTNQKNKETATEINASKDKKRRISAKCHAVVTTSSSPKNLNHTHACNDGTTRKEEITRRTYYF